MCLANQSIHPSRVGILAVEGEYHQGLELDALGLGELVRAIEPLPPPLVRQAGLAQGCDIKLSLLIRSIPPAPLRDQLLRIEVGMQPK